MEETNLEYKVLLTVFTTVFIAELGDKTQLATMLFAADKGVSKLTVFIGASLALIVASGIGVLAGGVISHYISEKHLHYIAGIGFIGIGIWTLLKA
jgi:putative Ca2+/H+ antiporter (TMEM165/GDT1 family)